MDSESNPFSESLVASNMRDSRDWSPLGYPTNITRDITDLVNGMSHQAHNGILLGPPKGMTRFNRSPGFRLFFSNIGGIQWENFDQPGTIRGKKAIVCTCQRTCCTTSAPGDMAARSAETGEAEDIGRC